MKTNTPYGLDIGNQRSDDIDRLLLDQIKKQNGSLVLNLGSGNIGQSSRMDQNDAKVTAVDICDYTNEYSNCENIIFVHSDALDYVQKLIINSYDITCIQRMIHYYPYKKAKNLLKQVHNITKDKLYISVTGLDSDVGRLYFDRNKSVNDRFCKLKSDEQNIFSIREPICLYTQSEFKKLITDTGWEIEKLWTSDFGNHKAVCVKITS